MRDGKWISPHYAGAEAFEKDYSQIVPEGLDVYCPGCRGIVSLKRKSPTGRIGAWCRRCNRGVGP